MLDASVSGLISDDSDVVTDGVKTILDGVENFDSHINLSRKCSVCCFGKPVSQGRGTSIFLTRHGADGGRDVAYVGSKTRIRNSNNCDDSKNIVSKLEEAQQTNMGHSNKDKGREKILLMRQLAEMIMTDTMIVYVN